MKIMIHLLHVSRRDIVLLYYNIVIVPNLMWNAIECDVLRYTLEITKFELFNSASLYIDFNSSSSVEQ